MIILIAGASTPCAKDHILYVSEQLGINLSYRETAKAGEPLVVLEVEAVDFLSPAVEHQHR